MKKMFILLIIMFSFLSFTQITHAEIEETFYFFWGKGCNYCEKAKPFINQFQKKYTNDCTAKSLK